MQMLLAKSYCFLSIGFTRISYLGCFSENTCTVITSRKLRHNHTVAWMKPPHHKYSGFLNDVSAGPFITQLFFWLWLSRVSAFKRYSTLNTPNLERRPCRAPAKAPLPMQVQLQDWVRISRVMFSLSLS